MDVDPNLANPPEAPKQHENLWFLRGDVILSTDKYLFKVHKDILSLQSSVFKDMFDLPTVEDDAHLGGGVQAGFTPDLCEGLPLVSLVGDNGEDVAHLLRAVYERQYYDCDNDSTPLNVIIALLVLSTKYDFKHIRKEVIKQISRHYPMALDSYSAIDDDDSEIFGEERHLCHFPLLKALSTANVEALLPICYYACADYRIDFIFDKHAEALGPTLLSTLLQGRARLEEENGKLIARLPDELGFVCPSGLNCPNSARVTGLAEILGSSDLQDYEGHTRVVSRCVGGACAGCMKILGDRINAKRQAIWDEMPSYFGFPGWDVLSQRLEEIYSA